MKITKKIQNKNNKIIEIEKKIENVTKKYRKREREQFDKTSRNWPKRRVEKNPVDNTRIRETEINFYACLYGLVSLVAKQVLRYWPRALARGEKDEGETSEESSGV